MKKIYFLLFSLIAVICLVKAQEQTTTKMRDVLKEGPVFDSSFPVDNTEKPKVTETYYKDTPYTKTFTAGDRLFKAGANYITGFVFGTLGSGLLVAGALENNAEVKIGGYILGAVAVIFTFNGHIQLCKAGKAYNKENIYLAPASEGIGMSINF